MFGYFGTYLLGAMYATQIYQHAASQIPDLEAKIEAGDFKPLRVGGGRERFGRRLGGCTGRVHLSCPLGRARARWRACT